MQRDLHTNAASITGRFCLWIVIVNNILLLLFNPFLPAFGLIIRSISANAPTRFEAESMGATTVGLVLLSGWALQIVTIVLLLFSPKHQRSSWSIVLIITAFLSLLLIPMATG
ncbi:MAG: hypothetical protein RLN76_02245 [Phycisphaeraceae bacterium]